jgi:hypothetical protein
MNYIKRPRAFYLFACIIVCCVLITGCRKPNDVDCVDLSEQAWGETIICADGNEPQVCMGPESDHCGFYVNAHYIPCKSCYDCDAASDMTVALCLGR